MDEKVIPIFGVIQHDQPVEEFLDLAKKADLETCLVIGQTENGEIYVGGNTSEFEKMVYLFFRGQQELARIENCFPRLDDGTGL